MSAIIRFSDGYYKVDVETCTKISENDAHEYIDNGDIFISADTKKAEEEMINKVQLIVVFSNLAEKEKGDKNYEKASALYECAAEIWERIGEKERAQDYYAYSAIMMENSEKWRHISALWYKASGEFEQEINYTDYNTLEHTYPTISKARWDNFPREQKKARALQYAAYSEDNYGGPPDSYWLYNAAVVAYDQAGESKRKTECLISATNRYVKQYNKLPDDIINSWKNILTDKEFIAEEKNREMIILAFEEIYKTMNRYDSEKAEYFFIESKKLHICDYWKEKKYLKSISMRLWQIISNFGTSLTRIIILAVLGVVGVFPLLFSFTCKKMTFVNAIIVSVNNFFGIEYIASGSGPYYAVGITEVVFSYFILAIIGTFIIGKVVND